MDCLKAVHISTRHQCDSSSLTAYPVEATAVAVKNYQL